MKARYELVAVKSSSSRWSRTHVHTRAMSSDSPCQVLRSAYHMMWELRCTSVRLYRVEDSETHYRRYLGSCELNDVFISAAGRYWLYTGDEKRYLERIDPPKW